MNTCARPRRHSTGPKWSVSIEHRITNMTEAQTSQLVTQVVTASVALAALFLSIFNFYWSNLRHKKALFFVRVLTPSTFMEQPQFALVNGSNRDVLITGIHCFFLDKSGLGSSYPNQTLITPNGSGAQSLLEPGKAVQYWIKLPEKYEAGFHLEGEYRKEWGGAYVRQMNIDIQWVDNLGKSHQSIVPFQLTGFKSNDVSFMSNDLPEKRRDASLNLYDKSVHLAKNIFG